MRTAFEPVKENIHLALFSVFGSSSFSDQKKKREKERKKVGVENHVVAVYSLHKAQSTPIHTEDCLVSITQSRHSDTPVAPTTPVLRNLSRKTPLQRTTPDETRNALNGFTRMDFSRYQQRQQAHKRCFLSETVRLCGAEEIIQGQHGRKIAEPKPLHALRAALLSRFSSLYLTLITQCVEVGPLALCFAVGDFSDLSGWCLCMCEERFQARSIASARH